jgi:hypothetical protein
MNIFALWGVEPAILAVERQQTHALDRAAIRVGIFIKLKDKQKFHKRFAIFL